MRTKRAQSILELSVLFIIVIAALITMQIYIKRGVQGRWKEAADNLGDQFDPERTSGRMIYTRNSVSSSRTWKEEGEFDGETGYFTMREDHEDANEETGGRLTTTF